MDEIEQFKEEMIKVIKMYQELNNAVMMQTINHMMKQKDEEEGVRLALARVILEVELFKYMAELRENALNKIIGTIKDEEKRAHGLVLIEIVKALARKLVREAIKPTGWSDEDEQSD